MRKFNIWFIGVVLFFALVLRVVPPIVRGSRGNATLTHEFYWMVHGYKHVWYHHHTYVNPKELTFNQVVKQYGGKSFVVTGEQVIGFPVYNKVDTLASNPLRNIFPKHLILQKHNGNYIEYSLKGGS